MDNKKNVFAAIGEEIFSCVEKTGEIISEAFKKEHVISNAANLMDEAAQYMMTLYSGLGYQVQEFSFEENDAIGSFIQISNDSGKFLTLTKSVTGLKAAACIKLLPLGDDLKITVCNGKWLDKIAVGVVSWFVLHPLLITSAIGAWRQKSLLDKIEREMLTYFANNTTRMDMFI